MTVTVSTDDSNKPFGVLMSCRYRVYAAVQSCALLLQGISVYNLLAESLPEQAVNSVHHDVLLQPDVQQTYLARWPLQKLLTFDYRAWDHCRIFVLQGLHAMSLI